MLNNFQALDITNFYFYIAAFSTTLYILKLLIFSIFGGDAEVHADFNDTFETETSFDFLSIQSILAFFMGLGWMGLTCINSWQLNNILSVLCAIIFGFALMFGSAYLMMCVKKLNKTVKRDYNSAVGQIGKAYTKFDAYSEGQIEIELNKQLLIIDAINNTDEKINSFENIKVIKFENNKLYIEKI